MNYVLSQSYPVARKEHVCDWCGIIIEKGLKYYSWTDTYDGIQTGRMHNQCAKDSKSCADHRECMSEYEDERAESRKSMKLSEPL